MRSLTVQTRKRIACDACATQSLCPVGKLSPAMATAVMPLVRERVFKPREVVQYQGAAMEDLRVLKSGAALLYRDVDGNHRLPVAMAFPGQVMGAAQLVGVPSILTVVAATEIRMCELPLAVLEQQDFVADSGLRGLLFTSVLRTMSTLADWAQVTRMNGVRQRLAGALLLLDAQQRSERVRLPGHATLAELLGVTRESVVRGMKALEQDGCILRAGRTYCELQTTRLKDVTAPEPAAKTLSKPRR